MAFAPFAWLGEYHSPLLYFITSKTAVCFQIRSLDKNRFPDAPAGRISETKMAEIEAAIRYCLGL